MQENSALNNDTQPEKHDAVFWGIVAIECLFWSWCSFTLLGGVFSWLNRHPTITMPIDVEVTLVLGVPVAAVLVVLASHLGWFRRKRAG